MEKKDTRPSYRDLQKKVGELEGIVASYRKSFISTARSLNRKKEAELEIKEDNEHFRAIMDSVDAMVYVADMETYELLFTNRYFDRIFGKNRVGEKCYTVLQNKSVSCDFCTNRLLVDKDGKPNKCHVWEFQNLVNKRWYQCHDQGIFWSDGRIVRLEVAADITGMKEYQQQLKEQEVKLRQLNSMKDKFFSIIAHDLKNPFAVLQSGAELLSIYIERNNLVMAKAKSLVIADAIKQVNTLLENLLVWAKSQTNALQFEPVNFNLRNFVSVCISEVENHAKNKAISIINEVAEEFRLFADKRLLTVVFRNLFTNAVKFTHYGGLVIVRTRLEGEVPEITVLDTGIGIPKEDQDKLFRIDTHYTRLGTAGENGTSLGLVLCREFIEKHGGKIWVESEANRGSEFKFTIPIIHKNSPKKNMHTGLTQTAIEFPG